MNRERPHPNPVARTPISRASEIRRVASHGRCEIRFTSKCNVWAIALDNVDQLQGVYAGEDITVMEAELEEPAWQGRSPSPPHRAGRHHRLHAGACPLDDASG
jgi:uncharacterized protein